VVANSALGGGAAVLGGGKFENGAITGASGYLFNAAGGRVLGHVVGWVVGGVGGIETGPADIFVALAVRHALGEIFSRIEDSIYDGIIYLRTDTAGGEYVGQAKSEERYDTRQAEHAAKNPEQDFEFQILERVPANSGRSLDVAEAGWIRAGGGPRSDGGALQNGRYQMDDLKYRQAGGTVNYP
jgi:hypothetical protein